MVKRVLIDNGSLVDIIFLLNIRKVRYDMKNIKQKKAMNLVEFKIELSNVNGIVVMLIMAKGVIVHLTIMVADASLTDNTILEHPWVHDMKTILSTHH